MQALVRRTNFNELSISCRFPKEHPFNRDGYRYVLAEADPHAPFRQVLIDLSLIKVLYKLKYKGF